MRPRPVNITIPYVPLPKQHEFHVNGAKYRFFGGGWGNGKTSAGCAEAFTLAMEYPGCTGLIARKTRPELKASTQHHFFHGGGGNIETDWPGCPDAAIRGFNKSESRLELINGSIIHFWPLDDPDKLSNLNLGWFLIDQGEEVAEEMFMMLQGRLRQQRGPRVGIVLFNPNGHDWIWRRVVNRATLKLDHSLIHAKTSDNPTLPPDYVRDLSEGMPRQWVERFLEGSFDVFSGQIWPEFDPDIHVIDPFELESWMEMVESIDHGLRNPTSILWLAYANIRGHDYAFAVDEHLVAGQLVGYHAEALLEKRETWGYPLYTVIDASAARRDPNTGRSVMDEYQDYGVMTVPSDRHVMARINRVAEWLRMRPEVPHPLTGRTRPEGYPRLYFFRNCHQLAEHVQQYQWRRRPPNQLEDGREQPLEKDDHDVDSLGYNLMTRPIPANRPEGEHRGPQDWFWEKFRERADNPSKSSLTHSMLGSEA